MLLVCRHFLPLAVCCLSFYAATPCLPPLLPLLLICRLSLYAANFAATSCLPLLLVCRLSLLPPLLPPLLVCHSAFLRKSHFYWYFHTLNIRVRPRRGPFHT